MEYDLFSIYGFNVLYPSTSRIELNPDSSWIKGDVAFKLENGVIIFISWGPLKEVRGKRYLTTEEHAQKTLERIQKSREVKKMELREHKKVSVNEHEGSFNLVSIVGSWGSFFRISEKRVCSVHIHCEESGRYFVIYGDAAQTPETMEVFNQMISSFKCHQRT